MSAETYPLVHSIANFQCSVSVGTEWLTLSISALVNLCWQYHYHQTLFLVPFYCANRVLALWKLNFLPILEMPHPVLPHDLTTWVGLAKKCGERKVYPSVHEPLPCRGILGDFPSAPMSRMSLPYSTVRAAVPSLPEQRLLLRTFLAGLPAWAGALQGRKTPTAERRRWEHPCSALQPGPLLPTLQRWPVWWGSGDTGAGLAPCRYRGTLLSALIPRWSFWLPPRSQDAPELKKQKGKLKEMITLFRGPQRTWENMQGSGYPGQNCQTSFLSRFHINHVRSDKATTLRFRILALKYFLFRQNNSLRTTPGSQKAFVSENAFLVPFPNIQYIQTPWPLVSPSLKAEQDKRTSSPSSLQGLDPLNSTFSQRLLVEPNRDWELTRQTVSLFSRSNCPKVVFGVSTEWPNSALSGPQRAL